MKPLDKPRIFISALCSLVAMVATFWAYFHRDAFFTWAWVEPNGEYVEAVDPKLLAAARDYAEAGLPGRVCVEKWIGRDDRYLYLALGCAAFRIHLGEVHIDGDPSFLPTRFRYSGERVSEMEQPNPEAFANGVRRIFPQRALKRFRLVKFQSEYQERGLARMAERGFSTLGR